MSKFTSIDQVAAFAKRKGFAYPHADIYGGLAGFFDLGPLGVELNNNLKKSWWNRFVHRRSDVVGIEGTVITSAKIWKASGHLDNFSDAVVIDEKTKEQFRADTLVEEKTGIACDGKTADELMEMIAEHNITSPAGNPLIKGDAVNLMFPIRAGSSEGTNAYLRGETAQSIFVNFRNVTQTTRVSLPFGIAQIGRSFRNEISPRDFLFRTRELEQMELEYFFDPEESFDLVESHHMQFEVMTLLADGSEKKCSMQQLVDSDKLTPIHAYWLAESLLWFQEIGLRNQNLRIREHTSEEMSHYSSATFDVEYNYPHLGFKELQGTAHRGNFDLRQHQEHSKQGMEIHDDRTNKKVIPEVIEPAFGLGRTFLALLCEAYLEDADREQTVLHLPATVAPYTVAVFPLTKKLSDEARGLFSELQEEFVCYFDESGSIGRRYARQDEVGTPYCITVDFDTLEDSRVTLRDRDSTEQKRVAIDGLSHVISDLVRGKKEFKEL